MLEFSEISSHLLEILIKLNYSEPGWTSLNRQLTQVESPGMHFLFFNLVLFYLIITHLVEPWLNQVS